MNEKNSNIARLGAFVLIGTTCLVLGLYYIGSNKNIFNSTISLKAGFNNIGGLMPGNNVRFNGINVGTVSKVYPVSDTTIEVEFNIDESAVKFISQTAIASIGTDGLLGNKIINITSGVKGGKPVEDGNTLITSNPIQMDKALRTLTATSDNLNQITANLKDVTEKFKSNNSLWNLLSDSVIADNVRNAVVRFKVTSDNTAILTGDISKIVKDIKAGKGTAGALLTDTMISKRLNQTIVKINALSDSVAYITGDFRNVSMKLRNGNGGIGTLLTDTTFIHNLNASMVNIKDASGNLNANMEALKHSWPFKKYFRKQKKVKAK